MTNRRRIVFHSASLRGGGAERVFVVMANELATRGHDVTLFTWNGDGPNAGLVSSDVKVVDLGIPIRGEGYGKLATLKGTFRSAGLFRRLRPDAVFSAPEFANLVMTVALLLAGSRAKFFPTFHAAAALPASGFGARAAVWFSRLISARASKAIAVSAGVGRDIAARGISASKVVAIHNPTLPPAPRQPAPHAWEGQLAAIGDGPVIATAGRLVPVKDHRTLLEAFALLRKRRPARLAIFGDGPLESQLRTYASELNVANDVLFAGYVGDLAAGYAAADVFVLSSTSEGFGNVLVEAMAAGVPVVSTDAPHGPREILDSGRFGALVPVGDAQALADAIERTLDRPPPEAELKRRAEDFDTVAIGNRYEALL